MWFSLRSARWLLDHNSCQEAEDHTREGSGPLGMVSRPMPSKPERRTRVTLRCLREDLDVGLPPVEIDLGSLDHSLIAEARRLARRRYAGRSASSRSIPRSYTGCAMDGGVARGGYRPRRRGSGSAP